MLFLALGLLSERPSVSVTELQCVHLITCAGVEDDEWDDEWDDVKSTSGYAESEAGDGGAMQRGGAHASMKISLNK